MERSRRLYKDKTNGKIFGVCAGIANYFEVDPTVVRLAWIVFSLMGGCGVLAYLIAAIVMPNEVS